MSKEKEKKSYTKRTTEQFNKWRSFFQVLVCKFFYMIRFKFVYRLEVHGLENVPKDNAYIVCPNHLSTLDPPLMVAVLPRNISFMAKKELFDFLISVFQDGAWTGLVLLPLIAKVWGILL